MQFLCIFTLFGEREREWWGKKKKADDTGSFVGRCSRVKTFFMAIFYEQLCFAIKLHDLPPLIGSLFSLVKKVTKVWILLHFTSYTFFLITLLTLAAINQSTFFVQILLVFVL